VPPPSRRVPDRQSRVTALTGAGGSPAVLLMRSVPVGDSLGALVNFRNLAFMPFSHVPAVPAADVTALPMVSLVLVAAVLTASGNPCA
jgi:putative exporter of polyketide antibiotics